MAFCWRARPRAGTSFVSFPSCTTLIHARSPQAVASCTQLAQLQREELAPLQLCGTLYSTHATRSAPGPPDTAALSAMIVPLVLPAVLACAFSSSLPVCGCSGSCWLIETVWQRAADEESRRKVEGAAALRRRSPRGAEAAKKAVILSGALSPSVVAKKRASQSGLAQPSCT